MRQIYCDFVGRIWSSGPVSKVELLSRTSPETGGDSLRVVAVLVLPEAALRELGARLSLNVAETAPSGSAAAPAADEVVHVTLQTIES